MKTRNLSAAVLLVTLFLAAVPAISQAKPAFRPVVGKAMGLVPARSMQDPAQGQNYPVVYHGGPTMTTGTVTVHTIFWAPSGYQFSGSPSPGVLGYEPMIQQFFTDVAAESGSQSNVFSILDQYGDDSAPGQYSIAYNPATDSIDDTDPYPAQSQQCPSPAGVSTCITDEEVTSEINHIIQTTDPSGTGLHDVWEVFLPPDVDECITIAVCGTTEFAGYHSWEDEGNGTFIYAVLIDTIIEEPPIDGFDPEGNPEAEETISAAAHETIEAMTNPEGAAWMDPNGFEVADKCENPEYGTPLGYAPDGAPYNQMINGHEYLIQEMWSNAVSGCVQSSTATTDGLPLPEVSLRQWSPDVSGNIGSVAVDRSGIVVQVSLLRAGSLVASGLTRTNAAGAWAVVLRGPHGALHATGDDRDEVIVAYGGLGPGADLIATGSGGDPFAEEGWTGWLDLDTGSVVLPNSVTVSPCSQTGVLTLTVNGTPIGSPTPECGTATNLASVFTSSRLTNASRILLTSEDNRASSPFAPSGALVSMTLPLGEPNSVSDIFNNQVPFIPAGEPACTAELRLQAAQCSGLVPGDRYTLTRSRGHLERSGKANVNGVATFALGSRGGDVLTLTNSSRRTLTALHVAHLRVAIDGNETVIASGTCQPGDYWGPALTSEPASPAVDYGGAAGLGTICPASGKAKGLPDAKIAQVDDLSGGVTQTSVPLLKGTAPADDAIVYGAFRALAQTGVPGPQGRVESTGARVALTITPEGARRAVFRAANVAGGGGVAVGALPDGVYSAKWVVRDTNGDTRTVLTKFVEQ